MSREITTPSGLRALPGGALVECLANFQARMIRAHQRGWRDAMRGSGPLEDDFAYRQGHADARRKSH
ncbi:hypothetical protein AWB76_03256 [Caballeronia temeraria]|uniref:Uncharacterized protein n=1 Tax=Caballeronia temeraria TaxID=1777137 RepID=A0A158AX10_9BURK|nr:hypothetical protein [Caballeronia temeraria]SAK62498.1 hypothetical protein AWB76_03256 [Caballeronia temeraria]